MPKAVAWEDLWNCPTKRPFWCSHPHCLWCNWDDEDCDNWVLAAHLGETQPEKRYYDPRFPEGHYIQDRRYVAWLCDECAADAELESWFVDRVRKNYPDAAVVRAPGSPNEATMDPLWQGVAAPPSLRGEAS